MGDPQFRFSIRAAKRDPEGYYVTRWDRAEKITVIGATQDEAMDKATAMLGDPGWKYRWVFVFDSSDEILDSAQQAATHPTDSGQGGER